MCATGTLKDVCTSCDFLPSSVSILNFIINEECVGQMMVKALGCFALKALSVTTLAVCLVKITKYEYYLNYIYVIVCKLCRRRLFETKSSISHNCSLASVLSQLHLPSIIAPLPSKGRKLLFTETMPVIQVTATFHIFKFAEVCRNFFTV